MPTSTSSAVAETRDGLARLPNGFSEGFDSAFLGWVLTLLGVVLTLNRIPKSDSRAGAWLDAGGSGDESRGGAGAYDDRLGIAVTRLEHPR